MTRTLVPRGSAKIGGNPFHPFAIPNSSDRVLVF